MTKPACRRIVALFGLAAAQAAAALAVRAIDPSVAEPAGEPSIAADGEGGFVLTWQARLGEGETALRFRHIALDGTRGPAGEIARGRGWFANWADFPSLIVLDNGDWLAHWLERSGPGRYAYDVRIVRSRDRGATWSAPLTPHDDGTQTEHGFVAWVPSGGDGVRAIWLDGRHTGGGEGGHDGHGHGGGAMTLRSARIGRDDVADPAELDARVCDCCQTDAVRIGKATLVVYRDRSPEEIRDVHLVRHDGRRWQPSQPLFADGWVMPGCPVNGPALAARGDDVAAAAYSGAGDVPRVKLRISRDGGRRWGDAITVADGGTLGRIDLAALPDGRFLLSRIDEDDDDLVLRVALIDSSGATLADTDLARLPSGRLVGFPRMAAVGATTLIAWTESADGAPRIRAALIDTNDE